MSYISALIIINTGATAPGVRSKVRMLSMAGTWQSWEADRAQLWELCELTSVMLLDFLL